MLPIPGINGTFNTFREVLNPLAWIDPYGLDWNYRLRDAATGQVYYHGRASDNDTLEGVASRHGGTVGSDGARMRSGGQDVIEQVTSKGTATDVARGIEQGGIVDGGTKTGTRSCNGVAGKARGNKIAGSSNPKKASAHKKAADAHLSALGHTSATQLPTLATHTRQ